MRPTSSVLDAVSQPFKRAQSGLFQGRTKQYGNNVPFSHHKTRRTWLPNVQQKRLPSEMLGGLEQEGGEGFVKVKLTTRALRTIKKKGGLEPYLRTSSPELLGQEGMRLRLRLLEQERRKLGQPVVKFTVPTPEDFKSKSTSSGLIWPLRREAAQALGKDGLASAEETIEYLKQAPVVA